MQAEKPQIGNLLAVRTYIFDKIEKNAKYRLRCPGLKSGSVVYGRQERLDGVGLFDFTMRVCYSKIFNKCHWRKKGQRLFTGFNSIEFDGIKNKCLYWVHLAGIQTETIPQVGDSCLEKTARDFFYLKRTT